MILIKKITNAVIFMIQINNIQIRY